ncbi:hypothetical protein RTG_00755 [Rhodotorula toruloides ATCC 204091]|uniref:NADH dehydrogenase [ubiquinone] iron-sulfur protein 5 n=1 Tax=Rhodotorula toruloides TaxID=5286 RepID=A0A2S9ZXC7_RHOTO|nr:hypothetical protein RTG_00755 [Rhodotorula toruloides ATCC 204091]PRQ70402.1 hypothetical protein AAT19DRAFT_11151 [Rhodotorula toruloides]
MRGSLALCALGWWEDGHFQKCYAGADHPNECVNQKEDYLECLHQTKELSRAMRIQSEYLNKTAHELQDKRKAAEAQVETGGILGLGLLQSEGGQAQEAKA